MTSRTGKRTTRAFHPRQTVATWKKIVARGVALAASLLAIKPKRVRVAAADGDFIRIGALTSGSTTGVATMLAQNVQAPSSGNLGAFNVQNSNTGDVILAQSLTATTPIASYAVRATANTAGGMLGSSGSANGVTGSSTSGFGVSGISTSGVGTAGSSSSNYGVYGQSQSGIGMQGVSMSTYGVIGTSSTGVGIYGSSTATMGNHGIVGTTNTTGFGGVHGLAGASGAVGLYGNANGLSGALAGYFAGNVTIMGNYTATGLKTAAVPFPDGSHRVLYCMESPEAWFEDFGQGALSNGAATITLDPAFVSVVDMTTLHLFLTPRGDARGLYVTDVTGTGFTVREQQGGTSSISFDYRMVAKRADLPAPRFAPFTPLPAPAPPPPLPGPPTP